MIPPTTLRITPRTHYRVEHARRLWLEAEVLHIVPRVQGDDVISGEDVVFLALILNIPLIRVEFV